jgi:hypothetical protein
MKRIILTVCGVLAISASVFAQRGAPAAPPALEPGASQADVDKALTAAPAQLRSQATVIKFNPDYTYTTLRKGTNSMVCWDKSGFPGQRPFSTECTSSAANLPRAAQNLKFEAEPDRAKRQAALNAAEKDGSRAKPEFGSVWYHLMGNDQASATTHFTIAVPGATTATLGLPEKGGGGVWIMDAGTSTAHLMTPGE